MLLFPLWQASDCWVNAHGLGERAETVGREVRDRQLSARHDIGSVEHQTDSFMTCHEEARAVWVRHSRRGAGPDALNPLWHHASSTKIDISIPTGRKLGLAAGASVGSQDNGFGYCLALAIRADGLVSFVTRHEQELGNARVLSGLNGVDGAVHVRADHLRWIVMANFDALERGGVDDEIDAGHGALEAPVVANVADEPADAVIVERLELLTHRGLGMLSARKHAYAVRGARFEKAADKGTAKETRTPGYENGAERGCHVVTQVVQERQLVRAAPPANRSSCAKRCPVLPCPASTG